MYTNEGSQSGTGSGQRTSQRSDVGRGVRVGGFEQSPPAGNNHKQPE
jgi:hypothetical protein